MRLAEDRSLIGETIDQKWGTSSTYLKEPKKYFFGIII
jgi:hypothetical protein